MITAQRHRNQDNLVVIILPLSLHFFFFFFVDQDLPRLILSTRWNIRWFVDVGIRNVANGYLMSFASVVDLF